jgi:hypothetical protein
MSFKLKNAKRHLSAQTRIVAMIDAKPMTEPQLWDEMPGTSSATIRTALRGLLAMRLIEETPNGFKLV